jgi:hypothetical protein
MRAFRGVSITAVGLVLSGCAVLEPRISVGPEDTGYCMPVNAGQPGQGSSVSYSIFEGRCPPGFARRYGGYRSFTGTADHFHHAIALLRDRRLEMERRDTELARLDAGARLLAFGAVGTVLGGLALSGTRDLVTIASLAAGGAVAGTTSFAPRTLREVLQAGVRALSCVESKAFSARIAPQVTQQQAAAAREAQAELARAIADSAFANRAALSDEMQTALTNANEIVVGLGRALAASRAGQASGPLIANAVYERTLAIVNQVNAELMRTTPTIEAVIALARGSAGLAVDGVSDTAGQLTAAISSARAVEGQALAGAAAPITMAANQADPALMVRAIEAGRNLSRAAEKAANAGASLLTSLDASRSSGVAQISACGFELAEGSAGLSLSPAGTVEVASNGSKTVLVSGGRGPYRVTRTGAETRITTPEFSLGPVIITARGAAAGSSAAFLVQDLSNPTVPALTIAVQVAGVERLGTQRTERRVSEGQTETTTPASAPTVSGRWMLAYLRNGSWPARQEQRERLVRQRMQALPNAADLVGVSFAEFARSSAHAGSLTAVVASVKTQVEFERARPRDELLQPPSVTVTKLQAWWAAGGNQQLRADRANRLAREIEVIRAAPNPPAVLPPQPATAGVIWRVLAETPYRPLAEALATRLAAELQ